MSSKKRKPDFNLRAKVQGYWMNLGAAWKLDDGNISVRLNLIPVGEFDGSILMLPPLEEKEDADKDGKE
jgi:hypothetical protein